jgi:S-disulfanyl-L-cysteine oxidoreductase SoxD
MSKRLVFLLSSLLLAGVAAAAAVATRPAPAAQGLKPPQPALGRQATAAQIHAWDIDVRPDGLGLPEGRGSVAEGEALFETHCASCHGTFGDSEEYVQLAGGVGTLKSSSPTRTVGSKLDTPTTLYDYINRAMPFTSSKMLTPSEVYAVSAYILNLNDIIPADATLDRESLPKVKMPNRDGYTTDHGFMRVDGKPDTNNTACMKDCETDVKVNSELPAGFTQQFYGDVSTNFRDYRTETVAARIAAAAPAAASAWKGEASIEKHLCTVCHAVDRKLVGPSYREVAARYGKQADAVAYLTRKLKEGSAGVWGVVPMPAQTMVPDDEIQRLVNWILEQK